MNSHHTIDEETEQLPMTEATAQKEGEEEEEDVFSLVRR